MIDLRSQTGHCRRMTSAQAAAQSAAKLLWSAESGIKRIVVVLHKGYTNIVDADLSKYFDTIPHSELLQCVARRIVDGQMLHLIKMWIKAPVEERDENGKRWRTCT